MACECASERLHSSFPRRRESTLLISRERKPTANTTTCVQSTSMPTLHRRIFPSQKPMVEPRMRKCSAGNCPPMRWRRGVAKIRRCQFAVPHHNSSLSNLGVPAPAGMSDCYESMSRTPIRDRPLRQPLIRHSRHPFVNSAPHSSFQRSKACPVPRYGAGIQKGWGWQGHHTYARIQASRDFHSPIRPSQAHMRIQGNCRIRLDKSGDHVNDTESL